MRHVSQGCPIVTKVTQPGIGPLRIKGHHRFGAGDGADIATRVRGASGRQVGQGPSLVDGTKVAQHIDLIQPGIVVYIFLAQTRHAIPRSGGSPIEGVGPQKDGHGVTGLGTCRCEWLNHERESEFSLL